MENKYGNKNGIKIKNIKIISQENNQYQIIVNLLKKCKL
jgi:phosphotransferase system IIB component